MPPLINRPRLPVLAHGRCDMCVDEKETDIVMRNKLAEGLPYQLCQACIDLWWTLPPELSEEFSKELWGKAILKHDPPGGAA